MSKDEKWVECVNFDSVEDMLTPGKKYQVIRSDDRFNPTYIMLDDRAREMNFRKKRFKPCDPPMAHTRTEYKAGEFVKRDSEDVGVHFTQDKIYRLYMYKSSLCIEDDNQNKGHPVNQAWLRRHFKPCDPPINTKLQEQEPEYVERLKSGVWVKPKLLTLSDALIEAERVGAHKIASNNGPQPIGFHIDEGEIYYAFSDVKARFNVDEQRDKIWSVVVDPPKPREIEGKVIAVCNSFGHGGTSKITVSSESYFSKINIGETIKFREVLEDSPAAQITFNSESCGAV